MSKGHTAGWWRVGLSLALLWGWAVTVPAATTDELATAEVRYRDVPVEHRFDGRVEAIHRSTVSAQIAARVSEVLFDVNDYVERGQVLVRFRDTEPRARLKRAEAAYQAALARLQRVEADYARLAALVRKKLVSRARMDKVTAERKAARARVRSTRAARVEAEEQLKHTLVRAPYSGYVVKRQVEVGELATPGMPLMTGVSLEALRVVTDLPQRLLAAVRARQEARIYLPGASAGAPLVPVRITFFPYADPHTHGFRVRLRLPEGRHDLFPGMFVEVGFVTGERRALVVPATSLVHRSEVTGVYVVDADGRPWLRQVRIGRRLADGAVVVLAGLDAGERVALDPVRAVRRYKAANAE